MWVFETIKTKKFKLDSLQISSVSDQDAFSDCKKNENDSIYFSSVQEVNNFIEYFLYLLNKKIKHEIL